MPPTHKTMAQNHDTSTLLARKERFQQLEAQIRVLVEERNALLPVARLPLDLLTHIFILARNATDGRTRYLPASSHVCRAWRAAALHCALLWTEIDCYPYKWANVMVERAMQAPLRLRLEIEEPR